MNRYLQHHVLTLLIFTAITMQALGRADAARPNIVFIFTDDHSPNAIGAYDRWLKSVNPTPNIDRLAAEGMLFERSFCTNSICGPVRAVIETGKHSHKNGFARNSQQFDWDQPTFPKLLREAGYQTVMYGKYHYFEYPGFHMVPPHRGIRTARFKLMHIYPYGEWEFYDLDADPHELTNQYRNPWYKEEIADLKVRLDALQEHYADPTDVSERSEEWQARYRKNAD